MVENLSIIESDYDPRYTDLERMQYRKCSFRLEVEWFLQDNCYNLVKSNCYTLIKGSKAFQFVWKVNFTKKKIIYWKKHD